jgi:hypothetical protein
MAFSLNKTYSDDDLSAAGPLHPPGFLLSAQGTSCIKPRGSSGSSPLRSDDSRDDQAGEDGPVEQSSLEAKSLKTRTKGLSGCHPNGQQPRQPDGGTEGQRKNYSHNNLLKETELKAALHWKHYKGNRQPAKESTTVEKGKDTYSRLQSCSC